jgi:soluble lytic murein transglycosylase-like protein
VQFWEPFIMRWSQQYGVEPNILATVIQIESCGHYLVNSPAGAQGLFQVMPFHFEEGENMLDPETNARRGIAYLIGSLERADGHIGLALAGYNGGWGVIPRGWNGWVQETRNYYTWGSTIYADAVKNVPLVESRGVQSWLNAGGVNLCRQAAAVLFPTPSAPSQ